MVAGLCGCGSSPPPAAAYTPDNGAPRQPWELELLGKLPTLPPGRVADVSGRNVLPSPAYTAASGQRCMRVVITDASGPSARLACEYEKHWHFAADVFAAEPAGREAP